jgi:subtilisin family serine protease
MPPLTGKGITIAIIDSGIDYTLPEFRKENGQTRIVEIYDQSTNTPYPRDTINQALNSPPATAQALVPITDTSGHGTAVTSIAAGTTSGVATESDILFIKLATPKNTSFPLTTQLMKAITYSTSYAVKRNTPTVINVSYGNTYGDHKGNSLLERYIDNASEIGKTAIIIGSGNESTSNGHTSGTALKETLIELAVAKYQPTFSLQIWKYYQDKFDIKITSPTGETHTIKSPQIINAESLKITLGKTDLLCYIGKPQPYNVEQELFIDFIPQTDYITEGIWQFTLTPIDVVTGEYRFYLSSYSTRNMGTSFIKPTLDMTITIPSTSRKAITVGAYDQEHNSYADFSGRGYVYRYGVDTQSLVASVKPDLVAPGVNITVPLPGIGTEKVSGTSFAAPYITGMSALLMEWGIIQKNDLYLYGERLKAALISMARPLGEKDTLPDSKIGWGKVDILR